MDSMRRSLGATRSGVVAAGTGRDRIIDLESVASVDARPCLLPSVRPPSSNRPCGTTARPLWCCLVLLPAVSWMWIVVMARDMYGPMTGASAWMMTMNWDVPHLLLLWAMWAVMMTGMMLPSASPLVLLYGAAPDDPHKERQDARSTRSRRAISSSGPRSASGPPRFSVRLRRSCSCRR